MKGEAMKIKYKEIKFRSDRLKMIQQANIILAEYDRQGFVLTLRQLYYQFVSRDLLPNQPAEYKRLGDVINDARLAGMIDWDFLEDRTRNVRQILSFDDPADRIASATRNFRIDLWANQKHRVEVWIEKDALVGVIEGVCDELRVPYFSCRGYTSQSEMWSASQRMMLHKNDKQIPIILHLGDHDPSGIDMSRDICDRLELFTGDAMKFERLALNMPQVEQYSPPPNPAKLTDSRCAGYMKIHGDESWELDALEPTVIARLIRRAVDNFRDDEQWAEDKHREDHMRELLQKCSDRWPKVEKFLAK